MAAISVSVPRVSFSFYLLTQEPLQISSLFLSHCCFYQGVPECVSFWHILIGESLFPTVLGISQKYALLAFKAKYPGCLSFPCRTPGLGSLTWDLDPLLLGENPEQKYENPDGSEILFTEDFFGNHRKINPKAGPFEISSGKEIKLF